MNLWLIPGYFIVFVTALNFLLCFLHYSVGAEK